jgi:LysR family glycine cleavage system transcriptional activator
MTRENWKNWMKSAGLKGLNVNHGPIFSHSSMVLQAAIHGQGVALGHSVLAKPEIDAGRLVCPFNEVLVSKNAYYVVCRESQAELGKISAFRDWMLQMVAEEEDEFIDG